MINACHLLIVFYNAVGTINGKFFFHQRPWFNGPVSEVILWNYQYIIVSLFDDAYIFRVSEYDCFHDIFSIFSFIVPVHPKFFFWVISKEGVQWNSCQCTSSKGRSRERCNTTVAPRPYLSWSVQFWHLDKTISVFWSYWPNFISKSDRFALNMMFRSVFSKIKDHRFFYGFIWWWNEFLCKRDKSLKYSHSLVNLSFWSKFSLSKRCMFEFQKAVASHAVWNYFVVCITL